MKITVSGSISHFSLFYQLPGSLYRVTGKSRSLTVLLVCRTHDLGQCSVTEKIPVTNHSSQYNGSKTHFSRQC